MDTHQENLNLLVKQREIIIGHITHFEKALHTYFFSMITVVTAGTSLIVSKTIVVTPVLMFIFSQAFFLVVLFLLGLLLSMNNHRDYIRAIDKHVEERYGITSLFYQGEISYKHINKFDSKFAVITTMGGVIAILLSAYFIVINWTQLSKIIMQDPVYSIIVIGEGLVLVWILGKNMLYKLFGKSRYYDDVYTHLSGTRDADDNVELNKDEPEDIETVAIETAEENS